MQWWQTIKKAALVTLVLIVTSLVTYEWIIRGRALTMLVHQHYDMQTEISLLRQDNERLREQQMRIIQALDNTYQILQEHLRGEEPKRPPPIK